MGQIVDSSCLRARPHCPLQLLLFSPFLLFLATAAQGQTYYYNQTSLQTGKNPAAVASADINRDGRLDFVVANKDDNTVSVILAKLDGSFASKVDYSVGHGPIAVAVGDLNKDGIPDLAVVNSQDNTVSVLIGTGDGTFLSPVTYAVGALPSGIALTDFNGDKTPDLAVINQTDQTISVLLGHGDGTFGAQSTVNVGGAPVAVVAQDFNGDGVPDIAAVDAHGNLFVLTNNGNASFSVKTSSVSNAASGLAAGDFNNDQHIDLVVAAPGSNELIVLLGDGAGNFQSKPVQLTQNGVTVQVADFNHDGKADFAVASGNGFPSGILILLGNGDGTFQSPLISGFAGAPVALIAGDFNNDNNSDVAAIDAVDSLVTVLLGTGDGGLGRHHDFTLPASGGIAGADSADFNGDGKPDVAVAQFNQDMQGITGFVSVLSANGDGTFQSATTTQTPNIGIIQLLASDNNGDGRSDVVMNDVSGNGGIEVLQGNGDGTFAAAVPSFTGLTGLNVQAIASGDFNGDHKQDVALIAIDSSNAFSPLYAMISNGDGTFQPHLIYNVPFIAFDVTTADFNHDGSLDIAVAATVSNSILIFLGRGDGTFQSPTIYNTGVSFTNNVDAADFNGDGKLDLAVGTDQGILFYSGNGDGTFQPPTLSPTPFSVVRGSVGTFSSTGNHDLAVIGNGNQSVNILPGNPDGSFRAPIPIEAPFFFRGFTFGSFNSDTTSDLILFSSENTLNASAQTATVFLSTPSVSFSASTLDFGTQNVGIGGPSQSVELTNQGNAPLLLTTIAANGSFNQTNNCPASLSVGQGCTLIVSFSPSVNGLSNGTLSFTDNSSPQSQALTLVGWAGPPDFFVSAAPNSISVNAGGTATYSAILTSGGEFSGTIQLLCSGAPAKATCSPSKTSAALDSSGPQRVQIIVTTTAPTKSASLFPAIPRLPGSLYSSLRLWTAALVACLAFFMSKRKRLVPLLSLTCAVLLLVSCGGGSSIPPVTTIAGTPPGSYVLTATATSGSISHQVTFTLVVN